MSSSACASESSDVARQSFQKTGLTIERCRLLSGDRVEHHDVGHEFIVPLSKKFIGELQMPPDLLLRGEVEEGNVLLIPAGLPHTAQFITDAEYLAIIVDHELVARAARDSRVEAVEFSVRHVRIDPVVSQIAKALDSERNSEGIGGRMYVESLANLLAVHMLRHYTASRPVTKQVRGGLGGFRLRRATEFINDNLERALSLNDIATEVGMSPFHFTREFKKATGFAPHQYLINGRISRAKNLLISSDLPIIEIGFRSGFKNQGHFTRLFRRLTAMTPKTFRQQVRQ